MYRAPSPANLARVSHGAEKLRGVVPAPAIALALLLHVSAALLRCSCVALASSSRTRFELLLATSPRRVLVLGSCLSCPSPSRATGRANQKVPTGGARSRARERSASRDEGRKGQRDRDNRGRGDAAASVLHWSVYCGLAEEPIRLVCGLGLERGLNCMLP